MNFKGSAKKIGDIDIPRIGSVIGVGEDELHAFMDVEAAGSGFDSQGRPKMLFEPHLFYRRLGKGAKRDAAAKAGLAYAKWGEKPYPRDSYPRLLKAIEIDERAAIMSASWGLTQILGENHAQAGYATPQEMIEAFKADEANHLLATVRLLKAWDIDDDLREHRWEVVARRWNGPGYKKSKYDTKMAAAYARWAKIKDTPYTPAEPNPVEVDTDKETIFNLQNNLWRLGYTEVGGADGKMGDLTKAAILAFRQEHGLPLTATIDADLLAAVMAAKPRELARQSVPDEKVKEIVPEVRRGWLIKIGAWIFGAPAALGTAVSGVADALPQARSTLEPIEDLASSIPPWLWFAIVLIVAGSAWYLGGKIVSGGTDAWKSGARR